MVGLATVKVVVATAVFVLVGLATVKVVVATAVFVVEFGEPFRNACAIATGFFVVECDFVFVFGFDFGFDFGFALDFVGLLGDCFVGLYLTDVPVKCLWYFADLK